MSKNIYLPLFLGVAFVIIVSILYSPVLFKGYPAELMGEEMLIAKNCAESGICGYEDDLNVSVASALVAERVNPSSMGNKLGPLSYSVIFRIFGWQSWNMLVLISAIIFAFTAIFFTLTVYSLFGLRVATIFPFVYTLLPFNWSMSQFLGQYEFALLYFSLFSLFYFWGRKQKFKLFYLVLAGIFLILSSLARDAMLLFLPIFFVWLLWYRRKEVLYVFIPVISILFIFWLPQMVGVGGQNDYLKLFIAGEENVNRYTDFHFYGHAYEDPYSFHFDREVSDKKIAEDLNSDRGFTSRANKLKISANMGLRKLSLSERLFVGTTLLPRHISKYFSLEYIGGPLFFLLMFFGWWQMRNRYNNKILSNLLLSWLITVPVLLSYVIIASRGHLVDFGFAIALLISLGLGALFPILRDYLKIKKYLLLPVYLFVILMAFYSLLLANHIHWGRTYDNTRNPQTMYLAEKINALGEKIDHDEVIAVGERNFHPTLTYLTSKSVIFFHPKTLIKLAETGEVAQAFDKFNVKYFIGYTEEVTDLIIKNSDAVNIAIYPSREDTRSTMSSNKSWFLNLVK